MNMNHFVPFAIFLRSMSRSVMPSTRMLLRSGYWILEYFELRSRSYLITNSIYWWFFFLKCFYFDVAFPRSSSFSLIPFSNFPYNVDAGIPLKPGVPLCIFHY